MDTIELQRALIAYRQGRDAAVAALHMMYEELQVEYSVEDITAYLRTNPFLLLGYQVPREILDIVAKEQACKKLSS